MKKINNYLITSVLVFVLAFGFTNPAMAATAVNLGTADGFAVLAGSGITISGAVNTTTITGDIGSFPTASITGLGNAVITGTNHAGDATTQSAKTALGIAYTAAGQPPTTIVTELGGTTKTAGVYESLSGTFEITGTLTLDGLGDPNAVFIFRTGTTLVTAGASNIVLINDAQACNVFWQVGSSATLGGASTFKGNILAITSASLGIGTNLQGRVLVQNGAVNLDTNTIAKATCIVPPVPTPTSTITNFGGTSVPPIISVEKVPHPLALPAGPGSVTYTYTVKNIGYVQMVDIKLVDNKCTPVNFISGDIDKDSILDIPEVWTYNCTTNLSTTTSNIATVTGRHPSGGIATDIAIATVVVGSQTNPPLINVVKKPASLNMLYGGGPMLYTYTVTNPGTEPLSNVNIADDKCTGLPTQILGHPGDLNKNSLLDSNETWTFTCQSYLTKTTTNMATAKGSANGLTAVDYAFATVVVLPVGLPNTGFSPEEMSKWNLIALFSSLILISTSIFVVLKKHKIN